MGDVIDNHEFIYQENIEGPIKWSMKLIDNVKEAYGNPEYIKQAIRGCDVVVSGYAPITREVMDASTNLKIIGISRGGPVNVDHDSAFKRGIQVLRTVGRNAESVADHTMAFVLSEMRNLARLNKEIKTGEYFQKLNGVSRSNYLGSFNWVEANGKILGLIGYGQIGSRVPKELTLSTCVLLPMIHILIINYCLKKVVDQLNWMKFYVNQILYQFMRNCQMRRII
jgi:phosphoglycerate dehydrogenase-like enzyme